MQDWGIIIVCINVVIILACLACFAFLALEAVVEKAVDRSHFKSRMVMSRSGASTSMDTPMDTPTTTDEERSNVPKSEEELCATGDNQGWKNPDSEPPMEDENKDDLRPAQTKTEKMTVQQYSAAHDEVPSPLEPRQRIPLTVVFLLL